jgi:NitT/TauT family transport system substrate-binding protein
MKRNSVLKILLSIVLINILAACAAFQPAEDDHTPIRVELTRRWGDYTLVIAQERGYFKKYGLDVELVYYDELSDSYPDLASGQIDGGLIPVMDIININRNAEMKVLAVSDDGGAMSIVAKPGINSVEDLNGKLVGVQIGSQYELMIAEMLQTASMDTSNVTVLAVNPEDAMQALESNKVEAVFTWEPFLSRAVSNGNRVLYPTDSSLRLFPNMLVFRRSMVEQRPDDVRAFLQAWFEAVEYRLQNPELVRSIAANYLDVDIEKIESDNDLNILTLNDNKAYFNIQSANSIYAITQLTSDYLISNGTVTQQVDPLELLDPTYLPK